MAQKPWGGRFAGETEKSVEDFTTSLSFDKRLYRQDIAGSVAHVRMLGRQGIIAPAEAEEIVRGLK
ncbi:MAG: argininosuccinate lyase, partial [Desulfobaccales bacterium]